jgi:SPP1 gp7 family putative phage head morphogenesis protein
MATSRYLINVFTRHQVYLERLKAGLIGEFDPTMRAIDKAVIRALTEARVQSLSELNTRQLNKLVDNVTAIEDKLLGQYAKKLSDSLKGVVEYEAQFAEKALGRAMASADETSPAKNGELWAEVQSQPVQATGQLLEAFTAKWLEKDVVKVEAVIRNAHAQGWNIQQTVTAIRGTKKAQYADGVLAGTQRDIEALVRTSVQHVSNVAREMTWDENQDIVIGVRFIATLDSRTTEQCAALDQMVFPLDEGPRPPLHINCRSTTIPEMAETVKLLQGGDRAARGAEGGETVPANQSYYSWLKTQPSSFQDTAIGPTRGKLLRDGGLSADEFARLNLNRRFEPLTLKEMKALAPEAFNRAGIEL